MFPSYKYESSLLVYFINMKDYILSLENANLEDEWENEQIQHKYNEVIIGSVSSKKDNDINIERNFYSLCHLMEENSSVDPYNYTVVQFYSKLNYISEKNKRNEEVPA